MKRTIKPLFVDDKNAYYKEFYEDCYRNRFDEDDDYKDVRIYLHKIVKHYYNKIKNVIDEPHMNSFIQLIKVMSLFDNDN